MRLKFLIIYFFLFYTNPLFSKHIIGGDITYKCLGNGNYEFELHIYRDCADPTGAEYDIPAFIAIYQCNAAQDCSELIQFDAAVLNVEPISIAPIEPPDIPCLILPPNICAQEAIYRFKLSDYGVSLPPSTTDSYFISYQRCCRNNTINNINRPESSGATYTIEITPEAQASCNSSPVFNDFPPTVICNNEPINFDHSATDPDGDQLVYSFCSPLLGGGLQGLNVGESAAGCDGVQPNPACPPPYREVSFKSPTYSAKNPLGSSSIEETQVRIDPNTGVITGRPSTIGQFVVGVCVQEFRNGVLLSTLQRDFQFNVADCEPTVVAQIANDTSIIEFGPGGQITSKTYLISSCGDDTVLFENESFQRSFVDNFRWEFEIDNQQVVSNDWDARIAFPRNGEYQGVLYLNPGTQCGDTANIFVNIFPKIEADFSAAYDTCEVGPVVFTDSSTTNAERIIDWQWDFGDGFSSSQRNPAHTYETAGTMPVSLRVTDNNNCSDAKTIPLGYYPAPPIIIISPNTFNGCAPANIFFNNLTSTINEEYDIFWDFGDGQTSTALSPNHIYEEPGIYSISLDITSPFGCSISDYYPNYIQVRPSPVADFSFAPEKVSILNPTASFTDESFGASGWFWNFGGQGTSLLTNPVFTFRDTGLTAVQLTVTHTSGCTDTIVQFIDVFPEVRLFMPNAFTPNDDGVNDLFLGKGTLLGARNYTFSIWNRWGERIFETSNPDDAWNGRKNNVGEISPNGVYIYIITFTGPRGKDFRLEGYATLIR